MTNNDTLANALSIILNSERVGKKQCVIEQSSKMIKKVLQLLHDLDYIGEFKEDQTSKGIYLNVELLGNINKCGVIKPRTPINNKEYDKFEKRYLPARNMGVLIISTPEGMITNQEARAKKTGGRLIAYCY